MVENSSGLPKVVDFHADPRLTTPINPHRGQITPLCGSEPPPAPDPPIQTPFLPSTYLLRSQHLQQSKVSICDMGGCDQSLIHVKKYTVFWSLSDSKFTLYLLVAQI